MNIIEVVAAIIVNDRGETLMVRKTGTSVFMQPGGKPQEGEQPVAALQRELAEELRLDVASGDLESIGVFESLAANEPGFLVRCHAFWCHTLIQEFAIGHEIAEARWVATDAHGLELAPLSTEHFFPLIRSAATRLA